MQNLIVYGTSNSIVVKLIDAINRAEPTYDLVGFVAHYDNKPVDEILGYPVLGGEDSIPRLRDEHQAVFFCHVNFSPRKIREADRLLAELDCPVVSLIDPAIDMTHVDYGRNLLLGEGTIVGSGVQIGNHLTCRMGSIISHDVTIEDNVYISPGVTVCGYSHLKEGCDLGAGATILPYVTIGRNTIVGAGSVVTKDLPDNVTAVGVPARVIKETGLEG